MGIKMLEGLTARGRSIAGCTDFALTRSGLRRCGEMSLLPIETVLGISYILVRLAGLLFVEVQSCFLFHGHVFGGRQRIWFILVAPVGMCFRTEGRRKGDIHLADSTTIIRGVLAFVGDFHNLAMFFICVSCRCGMGGFFTWGVQDGSIGLHFPLVDGNIVRIGELSSVNNPG